MVVRRYFLCPAKSTKVINFVLFSAISSSEAHAV